MGVEEHTAHLGVPQPLSMGRALPGTARDRPLAQTSGPACPRSSPGACRTHGKGWAGTARVVANCTSTSPSPWCGFVPLPLVIPEQSLALGWWLGVMLPGEAQASATASSTCWWVTQPWVHQAPGVPSQALQQGISLLCAFSTCSMVPPGVCHPLL